MGNARAESRRRARALKKSAPPTGNPIDLPPRWMTRQAIDELIPVFKRVRIEQWERARDEHFAQLADAERGQP